MQYGKRIGRQLERAEVLLGGALQNAGIARDLKRFGYTTELLERIQQKLRQAMRLSGERERAFAAQLAASDALQQARDRAELPFAVAREQARAALRGNEEGRHALLLEQNRGRNDALVRLGLVRRGGRPAHACKDGTESASNAEFGIPCADLQQAEGEVPLPTNRKRSSPVQGLTQTRAESRVAWRPPGRGGLPSRVH